MAAEASHLLARVRSNRTRGRNKPPVVVSNLPVSSECLLIIATLINVEKITCVEILQNKILTCLTILPNKTNRGTLQSTYIATSIHILLSTYIAYIAK
jgi:hypothetical protein